MKGTTPFSQPLAMQKSVSRRGWYVLTENKMKNERSRSMREFVKEAAYAVPAILTLQAAPAYAKNGSNKHEPEKRPKPIKIEPPKPK